MDAGAIAANSRTARVAPTAALIVAEDEAARMLSLAPRTLQGLRLAGAGPRFVQLTERRIGYAIADLHAWVERRSVASTSAATVSAFGR